MEGPLYIVFVFTGNSVYLCTFSFSLFLVVFSTYRVFLIIRMAKNKYISRLLEVKKIISKKSVWIPQR